MTVLGETWQYILAGVVNGAIYAVVAAGFVLIYSVTGIINFAQGEFAMVGALTAISLLAAHWPFLLALPVSLAVTGALGGALYWVGIRPARDATPVTLIFITLGMDIALRGLDLFIWGTNPYSLRSFTPGPPLHPLGGVLPTQALWVMGLALVTAVVLQLFFRRTYLGTAVRAAMVNRVAAQLQGVRPIRFAFWSFVVAAVLGALAGIVVAPITNATYDMGLTLGLNGFVAAILGGITDVSGAIVGGFVLGILESLAAGFISSGWEQGIAFLLLLGVLLFRPQGLFTSGEGKRV